MFQVNFVYVKEVYIILWDVQFPVCDEPFVRKL